MIYGWLSFLCVLFGTAYALDDEYAQAVHHSMWATFLGKDKKLRDADSWYQTIVTKPASPYSIKGYILFLAETHNFKKIVSYIPTYTEQFAHDATIQSVFAHALAHVGRQKESDALFIRLHKQFPTQQDIAFQAVQALVREKKINDALAVTQTIVNKAAHKHSNFVFHFLQSQLYVQLGKLEKARAAAQKCVALQPQFFKAWLMIGLVEEQLGNIDKAIQGYSAFLQTSKQPNAQIEQHVLALTLKQANQSIPGQVGLVHTSSLEKAIIMFKQQRYQQALSIINECLKMNSDPRCKLFKIQILMNMKKQDEAIAHLASWIKQEPYQQMWFSALHLLIHLGVNEQKIIGTLRSLEDQKVHTVWLPLYLADLYIRVRAYDQALDNLHRACMYTQDPCLKTDIYFQIALINYERGSFDQVAYAFEKGLTENILHAPFLNLAAYFYATKGKKLDKAEELIAQALRLEPSNQHYLDTRAVILYKQGAYDKAELLLSGILSQIDNDGTIILNLAKTKYKLGKIEEAHSLVRRAQTVVHNAHEHMTLKKLEQKWQLSKNI